MIDAAVRIAWATPWNGNSAIAVFSRMVVLELRARGHLVDIFRTEAGDASNWASADPLEGDIAPRYARDVDPYEFSSQYDVVVANFGDNFAFHGGTLLLVGRVPLVAVMHDANYDNFVNGLNHYTDLGAFMRSLGYGGGGSDAMVGWIAGNAAAAVAHGSHYVERLRSKCSGPVAVLPLVYPDLSVPPPKERDGSLVVATIGHINPNKRVDAVIEAIGVSPKLRQFCEYRVVGYITAAEERRLKTIAEEAGLVIPPRFTGWVSEDELRAHLGETDVVCALRHPVLEGGSASLVTALLSARPTLVSDQEHYAAPEGVVLKCAPGHEALDVARHLDWILENPVQGLEIGRKGREYALSHHSLSHYVDEILSLIVTGLQNASVVATRAAMRRTLASLQAPPGDPAEMRLENALTEMLGPR